MQNFAYFQWQPFNTYSCHCERDASCHMTCLLYVLGKYLQYLPVPSLRSSLPELERASYCIAV